MATVAAWRGANALPPLRTASEPPSPSNISSQIEFVGAVLLVVVLTALMLPTLTSPFAGGYHDDGIYIVTAKALAEGKGYVIGSLPQSIAQTKYPILFPALLSIAWTVHPDFPGNLPLLRLVPWLAMWVWLWLVWKVVAQELERRELAWWIVLLIACSPATLFFGTLLLSETTFAALGTWALLLMIRIDADDADTRSGEVLLLAAACSLAFHTRTIAIALIPAAAFIFWKRREWKQLALFVITWSALIAPWIAWQQLHPPPPQENLLYYTSSNYSAWNLITGAEAAKLGGVVSQNAVWLLGHSHAYWDFPIGLRKVWLLFLIGVSAIAGNFRMLRSHARAAAVWLLGTVALLLLWMWPPFRFMVPLMPVVVLAFTESLRILPAARSLTYLGRAVAGSIIVWGLWSTPSIHSPNPAMRAESTHVLEQHRQFLDGVEWIRTNTPDGSIVAGNLDPLYWLYTGRPSIRAFDANPYLLFYADSRPSGSLGTASTLNDLLASSGADYLVVEDLPNFAEIDPFRSQVKELEEAWPGTFLPAWTSTEGAVQIFKVRAD
jgi:hypothetical protein